MQYVHYISREGTSSVQRQAPVATFCVWIVVWGSKKRPDIILCWISILKVYYKVFLYMESKEVMMSVDPLSHVLKEDSNERYSLT